MKCSGQLSYVGVRGGPMAAPIIGRIERRLQGVGITGPRGRRQQLELLGEQLVVEFEVVAEQRERLDVEPDLVGELDLLDQPPHPPAEIDALARLAERVDAEPHRRRLPPVPSVDSLHTVTPPKRSKIGAMVVPGGEPLSTTVAAAARTRMGRDGRGP
ncbi:MAG: hypothetical protein ACR2NA_12975 [Solirubrobacterales bacterium]